MWDPWKSWIRTGLTHFRSYHLAADYVNRLSVIRAICGSHSAYFALRSTPRFNCAIKFLPGSPFTANMALSRRQADHGTHRATGGGRPCGIVKSGTSKSPTCSTAFTTTFTSIVGTRKESTIERDIH